MMSGACGLQPLAVFDGGGGEQLEFFLDRPGGVNM
jgi:hypothetical protein